MADDAPESGPARLIALLWKGAGEPPRRGRPSRLGLDRIVATAISLADTGGLGGLTMRALARALDASPMALYAHVDGRDELMALMLDQVCGAMRRRHVADEWRPRVEAMVRDNRDLMLQHPWIVELPAGRPPPGPGLAAKYDLDLRALDGLGLDGLQMDRTLAALLDFAAGSARQTVAARVERASSGLSDEEWWALHAPYLQRVFDAAAFPMAARVGLAAAEASGSAYDPEAVFNRGLLLMLDGLEQQLKHPGA